MESSSKRVELMPVGSGAMLNSENYARIAEGVMKPRQDDRMFRLLTTSKLRRIYSFIMNLYTQINAPEDFENRIGDLQYLKVKMAYEAGREQSVRDFLDATQLMNAIDSIKTYDQFMLYCRYAESLVAFFKFYGGKE
mgnify:CR=1 FL=1